MKFNEIQTEEDLKNCIEGSVNDFVNGEDDKISFMWGIHGLVQHFAKRGWFESKVQDATE